MRASKIFCLIAVIALGAVKAQSPAPIIVQAASAIPAKSTSSAPVTAATSLPDAIKRLEQVKAANDEVLAKQKAALERLDELQEAADQLRIFAKRG
jgi:ABC-type uncharacterized transport system fused permease/ATPase subunit